MRSLVLLLATLAVGTACRSASIRSDREADYDFGPLRTYQWISAERAGVTGLNDADLALARGFSPLVEQAFSDRGYVRTNRNPDFLVLLAATTQRSARSGGGSRPSRSRHSVRSSQLRIEEGTVLLRAWDTNTRALLWECQARDVIRESRPPNEESITRILTDMVARFPAEVPAEERP